MGGVFFCSFSFFFFVLVHLLLTSQPWTHTHTLQWQLIAMIQRDEAHFQMDNQFVHLKIQFICIYM